MVADTRRPHEYLTVAELAREIRVGRNTAYALVESGDIRGIRIGRLWRIPRESIEAWRREGIAR